MIAGKRTCIFCGSAPLTLEHMPPKWLDELCTDWDHGGTTLLFKDKHGVHFRGHAKVVAATAGRVACHRCNSGWMSQIENDTKPVLGPMTQGHGTRLGKREQDALARWLIKCSLVQAAMNSWDNTSLFEAAFQRFFELKTATLPWVVFVATHGGKESEFTRQYFARYFESDTPADQRPMAPAYLFTSMIGHFVGTVTYSQDMTFPQPDSPPLERISPRGRSFIWPRGRYMTLGDIDSLGAGPSVEELKMLRQPS